MEQQTQTVRSMLAMLRARARASIITTGGRELLILPRHRKGFLGGGQPLSQKLRRPQNVPEARSAPQVHRDQARRARKKSRTHAGRVGAVTASPAASWGVPEKKSL